MKEVNKNDNFPFGLQQTFIGPPDTFLEKVIRSVGVPPALAKLINDQNEELERLREENINLVDTLDKFLTEMSDVLHPNVEAAQTYNSLSEVDKFEYIIENSAPNIQRSCWNDMVIRSLEDDKKMISSLHTTLLGTLPDNIQFSTKKFEDEVEDLKSTNNIGWDRR